MNWEKLLAAAALLCSAQSEGDEGKRIFMSVPHGSFPEITKYHWEGRLPRTGDQVAVTFNFGRDEWEVTVSRGKQASARLQVRAKRFAQVYPTETHLWASYDEATLHLHMPFGEPQDECFANEVRQFLQLDIHKDGKLGVRETRFENCEAQGHDILIEHANGLIVIPN